jgi:hypothetical protein
MLLPQTRFEATAMHAVSEVPMQWSAARCLHNDELWQQPLSFVFDVEAAFDSIALNFAMLLLFACSLV